MGIGALYKLTRPFHHYALRTSHYALKKGASEQSPAPSIKRTIYSATVKI